jgi:hypothetical protein
MRKPLSLLLELWRIKLLTPIHTLPQSENKFSVFLPSPLRNTQTRKHNGAAILNQYVLLVRKTATKFNIPPSSYCLPLPSGTTGTVDAIRN